MKSVVIIHNHPRSFNLNIPELVQPEKYELNLITNAACKKLLEERNQVVLFKRIIVASSFDFESLVGIIENMQQESGLPLSIVTNAENAVLVCGKLRVYFGLQTENNERFINKVRMKQLLVSSGISMPRYEVFSNAQFASNKEAYLRSLAKTVGFPSFVKPVDRAGSVGTRKIMSYDDLCDWASNDRVDDFTYEVDEFIKGTLFHCDSFIQKGQIVFTQVGQDTCPCAEIMSGRNHGSFVLPRDSLLHMRLEVFTKRVHEFLGAPTAGVTHLEVFRTADDRLVFLEIAHRAPGGLIAHMYRKTLGLGISETNILLQIDDDFELNIIPTNDFAAWSTFPLQVGTVKSINNPTICSKNEIKWNVKQGDTMNGLRNMRDVAGEILFWNRDYRKLLEDVEYFETFNAINIL